MFNMTGLHVLVTGATGYLGREMVCGLGKQGAHVLINSRSSDRCNELLSTCLEMGISAEATPFDISDEQQRTDFLQNMADRKLHVLINNAYAGGGGNLRSSSSDDYRNSYEINIVAAQGLLQGLLPMLQRAVDEDAHASIINISSMYGVVSPDPRIYETEQGTNPPFYGAVKAALLQWTRYAACELGPLGIRVNAISPGAFPSLAVQNSKPDFIQKLAAKAPLNRVGQAHEIIGPVCFLASRASSFVNGANLSVDGGWTSW